MKQTANQENKMGTMSINQLLITMALPIIVSMLVQAMYNVVDSMFVARISEDALSAVSLAFPVQNLMISIAVGTGVGVNALLSRSLGAKNQKDADKAAMNGIFLAFCSYLLFLVLGFTACEFFFRTQTDNETIIAYGTTYLRICLIFSFGMLLQIMFERILQSTGRTMYTMITQGLGAILNIILDPILIFGLFGAPKMGIAGAAVATVIGQVVAACLAIYFNFKINTDVSLAFRGFRPDKKSISQIYAVAIPSILMMSISSVMVYGMNLILITFSSTATAVFGVYFKLQSFIFMPVLGLNNGMVPIIAYNYGACKPGRITKTIRLASSYAMVIMIAGFLLFQTKTEWLLQLFDASPQMIAIGLPALGIISWSFLLAGICIVRSAVFQALGRGMYSLIVAFIRQLVVLLPVAYLLSLSGNIHFVWWSFPIAEFVCLVVSGLYMHRVKKKIFDPMRAAQTIE